MMIAEEMFLIFLDLLSAGDVCYGHTMVNRWIKLFFEAGICVFVIQCIRILSKFDRREHKVSSI